MLSFLPRLVVHKEEVDSIFFPDARLVARTVTIANGGSTVETRDAIQSFDDNSEPPVVEVEVVPSFSGAIIRLASQVPGTIVQIASDLPNSVVQLANDLPTITMTREMAFETLRIPYRAMQHLPGRVVQLSEGVYRDVVDLPLRAYHISQDVAAQVVEIPHLARHNWKQLGFVLIMLVVLSLVVSGVVFFIPLAPASAGLGENRKFVYGIMTYYEALALLPWIETCNFAIPNAKIPVRARILTLVVGLTVQKLFDAFVAEAPWWPGRTIFPIPFSIIVSGALAFIFVVPILYLSTPNRKEHRHNFGLLGRVLCIYWLSLVLVGCWAVGMRRLEGRTALQSFVGFTYGPLRFVCKILLAAPLTTKLSPRRWIVLNMVVDVLFTRVQISTLPFIDGLLPLLLLFGAELLTLLWRYYQGIDRLVLWWTAIYRMFMHKDDASDAPPTSCVVVAEFGESVRDLTTGCFSAPIPHISQLSMTVRNGLTELSILDLASLAARTRNMATANITERRIVITIQEGTDETSQHDDSVGPQVSDVETCTSESEEGTAASDKDSDSENPPTVTFTDDALSEVHWEQRPLYHVIDAVGSTVISIVVRLNQQLSISLARNLPSSVHLNDTFLTTDARWKRTQIYSWIFIFLMLALLASLGGFFARLECLQGNRRLTLSRVMTYLYRDHFWFFFLWLAATGGYVCATMIQHFGADFTLQFQWLQCADGEIMDWPGCAQEL